MNCQVNYYRDDAKTLINITMLYFCADCRAELKSAEWVLLEKFHIILSQAWDDYWKNTHLHNEIFEEDYRKTRTNLLSTIYLSFKRNKPRDSIFKVFNTGKVFQVLNVNILDMIELLEEYDKLLQEKQNGKKRKTRTNKKANNSDSDAKR
jgi:hypothetical protein